MPTSYPRTRAASNALHAPDWHASCVNVELHMYPGRGPVLWCPDCRCMASLEAVADKVDLVASMDTSATPTIGGTVP